jgi:hypothetical protein
VSLDPAVQSIAFSDMISTETLVERYTFIETDIRPHSVEQWFTISDGLHSVVRINYIRKWSQSVTTLFDSKHIRHSTCFHYWPTSGLLKNHCHMARVSVSVTGQDFGNESSVSHPYKIPLKSFEMCV